MSAATPIDSPAYDRVTDALERAGMKRSGRSWTCPAHDDRTPSLSVTARDGRCLIRCFAGCEPEKIVAEIGLTMSDLFDEPRSGEKPDFMERATRRRSKAQSNAPPKAHRIYRDLEEAEKAVERHAGGKVVARYLYEDEQRQPVLCVFRTAPKSFRQATPEGDGWKLSTDGARLVPFRLPELLAAIDAGDPIYIVEGEKDVLAIEKAGGVATCNPMGAGKDVSQYADHFRGADVRIVADRDEPGRTHAQAWAKALRPIANRVAVVETVEGKDASDALDAGHSLESSFAPPRPAVDTSRFVFVGREAFDFLRAAPEPAWLVPSFLRVGKTTVLGGSTMTGKTWLALQTLSSIAAGYPVWPGSDADEVAEGVVVYIGYDPHMTVEDVARRLDVLDRGRHREAQRMKPGAWSERFVTVGSSEQRGAFPVDLYRLDSEGCERIAEEILRPIERERGPIRGIAVDTLSTALPLGVDENDNPAMTAVISRLSGLALDFKAAALTLHHPTKQNSSAGPKFQSWDPMAYFRGAGSIPSAAGVLAGMWAPIEHPTHRVLTCWSNSGRRKRWWFEVASVERASEGWIDYWWPGEAPESGGGEDEGEALESLARGFASDRAARLSFHAFVEKTNGSYTGAGRKGADKLIGWATKRGYLSREAEGAKRLFLTADGVIELAPFWGEANGSDLGTA